MRVLVLLTGGFGALGGIQQFNRHWVRALGNENELCVLQTEGAAAQIGTSSIKVAHGRFYYIWRTLWLAVTLRPAIIVCGHLHLAPLAWLAARMCGARLWLQVHGIEAWDPPTPLRKWAVERMKLVTAVSRFTRSQVLAWANLDPWRVRLLPNTVSERFSPGLADQEALKRLGINFPFMLTVGRLSASEQYKGHDKVISAMAELQSDVNYVIVGDGDDAERIRSVARRMGVSDRVKLLGRVDDGDLLHLYRAAELLVMPSDGEGFGIVYLEAAACGCKVLPNAASGASDVFPECSDSSLTLAGQIDRALKLGLPDDSLATRFSRQAFEMHAQTLAREVVTT